MKNATPLRQPPFLKILPAVVVGIITANMADVPVWMTAAGFIACMVGATTTGGKQIASSFFTYAAIVLFAASATYMSRPHNVLPSGESVIMTMGITDSPSPSGRWTKATAQIDMYRPLSKGNNGGQWLKADEKVVARFDSSLRVSAGDRLIATGYTSSLGGSEYAGYVRLLKRRGYTCNVWIDGSRNIIILPDKIRTPGITASKIRDAACERLFRLEITPSQAATAAAMSLGQRNGLQQEVRKEYSLAGASHLLAVSGLHVGIVAFLINLILWVLPSFRYGHIVKNAVAVVAIWSYALLTGLSPSVIRAAIMFTGAQIALAVSRTGNSANILLATATVMLIINPDYLYDVSFQLSFAAVTGIFTLYRPLYGIVTSRFRILNAFWAVFMVGLAATIATAPLVAYHFGHIPIIGLIINPVLILTANVTVLFSLLWTLLPLEFLNGFFSSVIGFSSGLQNLLVESCSSKRWASLPISMEIWQVCLIYAAGTVIYILMRRKLGRKRAVLISKAI